MPPGWNILVEFPGDKSFVSHSCEIILRGIQTMYKLCETEGLPENVSIAKLRRGELEDYQNEKLFL